MAQVRMKNYAEEPQGFQTKTEQGRKELWISVTVVEFGSLVLA